jgi:DNA-binding SARP family transcriptional activator
VAGGLLALLLLNRRRALTRETLAGLLWPEIDSDVARKNMRTALWRLRAALEPRQSDRGRFLITTAESLGFNPTSDYSLDVETFESLFERQSDQSADAHAERLRRACELYRGELLEGCYEDWCTFDRERLQKLYFGGLGELMSYHGGRSEYDEAVRVGQLILQHDRTQEHVHRELMRLHYAAGRRGVALQQYALCREILKRELNVEPMRETNALYEQIRQETIGAPVPEDGVVAEPGAVEALRAALEQLEATTARVREALERAERARRPRTNGHLRPLPAPRNGDRRRGAS